MKILLIGNNGQIGWELNHTLQPLGQVIALDYPKINLNHPVQLRKRIREIKPDLIVNGAAYTAVDKAEEEPELAMTINGMAPGIMAVEARRIGAGLIHYSTDYVFDGKKNEPYTEEDTPNPINTYGQTKLEGDLIIQSVDIPYLILRTGWVYGKKGKNFMLKILKLARENEEISIVDDQIGCPNWSRLIAEATAQIIAQGINDLSAFLKSKRGIYNLSGSGKTSWFGFAKTILDKDSNKKEHKLKHLIPITTSDYPTLAKRPAYSLLSTEAIKKSFSISLPDWESTLKLVLG